MKTLIIDDDPDILEAVALCFEIRWPGTVVITAIDGQSGMKQFRDQGADIVILDLGLPDMDGLEVCRQLREISEVPIIILTVRDQRKDIIRGLEMGADDYITKPFDQMELLARARAVLRRGTMQQTANEQSFLNGRLTINVDGREVRLDGNLIRLTPTEYNLLQHLAQNVGKLVTHREMLSRLWGQEYMDATDYLKVHVLHLRRKLGDDPSNPTMIASERGIGYRFIA
ncbi:MAG: response regulator transcription factor [Chloroflexi bacterium]|nr:response regulator transcription factor [Chloroflexota bacterium]